MLQTLLGVASGPSLPPIATAKEQALNLGLPFLSGFVLGWVWPVGSLDEFAALSNGPLKVPCRLLAGKDLE
jgi:hypothetical protein